MSTLDAGADAVGVGQFSSTDDALTSTMSSFVAMGYGAGSESSVVDITGAASTESLQVATSDGYSQATSSGDAGGMAVTLADFARNSVDAEGEANVVSGAFTNTDTKGNLGGAESVGYGEASANAEGNVPSNGYTATSASAAGEASSLTSSWAEGVYTVGTGDGSGAGAAVGDSE